MWVGDSGIQQTQDDPPTVAYPLWSTTLGALEPGRSVNVLVMASPDPSRPQPMLEASWPRLPGRPLGRKTCRYDLATARRIEEGWPGEGPTAA